MNESQKFILRPSERALTLLGIIGAALVAAACAPKEGAETVTHFGLDETAEIIVTSEAGDKLALKPNVEFRDGQAHGTVIRIQPATTRQTLLGIGSSFTESSAFVLAHLDPAARREVMTNVFGAGGANFALARTVVGATDFAVTGKYSYAPVAGDAALEQFSIAVDEDGFSRSDYPGVRDESYDLLPMIREALAVKADQADGDLRLVASAWTAPPWMKDIEDWYIGGSAGNNWQGTGGRLKEEYLPTYADYLVRYLEAYEDAGVDIWGMTPVNEPQGNNGSWESMHFTAETQRDFIKRQLGPALENSAHHDVKLLVYDQNRDDMEHWTDVILGDPEAAKYVYGTAVHWYASTFRVFEDTLARVHDKFPEHAIVHTEGTIDNLGVAAPADVADPAGFEESGWFDNDAFWWNATATDWAYSATWGPNAEDHPMYTPVHRYARNIIVSLDHWVSGWIDWNVVLDRQGGPNHVGNYCGAPIMIDTATGQVYYTPIYHVLAQFSRTIRPGDKAVLTETIRDGLGGDDLHASASVSADGLLSVQVLNTTQSPIDYQLEVGAQVAEVTIPANALQTVRVALD